MYYYYVQQTVYIIIMFYDNNTNHCFIVYLSLLHLFIGRWWLLFAADVGGFLACCLLNYVNKLGNIIQFIHKINKIYIIK